MDRPIIFSAPMVRALLEGRKTMTRRLAWRDGTRLGQPTKLYTNWNSVQPGDRLWVRENCWTESRINDGDGVRYPADGEWRVIQNTREASDAWLVMDGYGHARHPDNDTNTGQQVPSIHMPRWASRLTLTVTAARVERLQEISDGEAAAEGIVDFSDHEMKRVGIEGLVVSASARRSFWLLWNHLHGPGAWEANPEVVVLTFTVRKENIDA